MMNFDVCALSCDVCKLGLLDRCKLHFIVCLWKDWTFAWDGDMGDMTLMITGFMVLKTSTLSIYTCTTCTKINMH